MKENHTYKELFTAKEPEIRTLMSEYLLIGNSKPADIKRLSFHERVFFFSSLHSQILSLDPSKEIELMSIIEAQDYFFNFINSIYLWDIDFNGKHLHPITNNIITQQTQNNYKRWYNEVLSAWIDKVNKGKDLICNELKTHVKRKKDEINDLISKGAITRIDINKLDRLIYSRCFAIYFVSNSIFSSQKQNYKLIKFNSITFVINVRTIIHILFRHYIPSMDIVKESRSHNIEISNFDILFLDDALKDLITQYFNAIKPNSKSISKNNYWLLILDDIKHILWLKKSKKGQPYYANDVYEIASFYKCEQKEDLVKFNFPSFKIRIAPNRYAIIKLRDYILFLLRKIRKLILKDSI